MRLGVLFSGGKDSTLAAWLAKNYGHKLSCLITIDSENLDSFMFHTPSIDKTKIQADASGIPLIVQKTKGEKEVELEDLKAAIVKAKEEHGIEGVVTGAVESVYQATRVQKICNELGLEVFNPLWQKPQVEIIEDLISNNFKVIVVGIAAYPLNKKWLGRKIDDKFLSEMKVMNKKWGISVAGEGGEFESFVINCPLFEKRLEIKSFEDSCSGENSCRREVELGAVE